MLGGDVGYLQVRALRHWNDTEKIHPLGTKKRDRGLIPRAATKGKLLFFSNVSKILPAEGIRGPRRGVIDPLNGWLAAYCQNTLSSRSPPALAGLGDTLTFDRPLAAP